MKLLVNLFNKFIPTPDQPISFPFSYSVPSNIAIFKKKQSKLQKVKSVIRLYRRFVFMLFNGQLFRVNEVIPINVRRILWMNPSSTSIGDSIMELSGRVLLRDKYYIDLLTDGKNAELYKNDDIFGNVYTRASQIQDEYDFILLDINNTHSLRLKAKYFPKVKFAPIMGYFYGLHFNRILFSYHRINAIISYQYTEYHINKNAKNYLHVGKFNSDILSKKLKCTVNSDSVVLVVGGEDNASRTYDKWDKVIKLLIDRFNGIKIVLLGSANGVDMASKIMSLSFPNIIDCVNKLTLLETAQIIANLKWFIGVDGGLMHVAESFGLQGVALFAKIPSNLLTVSMSKLKFIYREHTVMDIKPTEIVDLFARIYTHNSVKVSCH